MREYFIPSVFTLVLVLMFANRAKRWVEDAVAAALHAAWPQTSPYLSPVKHLLDGLQNMEALQVTAPKGAAANILVSDAKVHI